MQITKWLADAEKRLCEAAVPTARLDCFVMLEDATNKDRAWLLARPEFELPTHLVHTLNIQVSRRVKHIPLAYIRGKAEFYGLTFIVNEHTLVPRPETEAIIELLRTIDIRDKQLIDVGTGSGAIAITAKHEFPDNQVIAIDIDENCLNVARDNAKALHANVRFFQGNLLEPVLGHLVSSVLLCNLPYVPNGYQINTAAAHEPRHAIFAGQDGLDLYRGLFEQIATRSVRPSAVLTEALPSQHGALAEVARSTGYVLRATEDFIQLFQAA